MIAPDPQVLFRDETTGLPLRDGYIYAYRDTARSVSKPVYMLTGTPGFYTYTQIPTVTGPLGPGAIQLTGIGTVSDGSGNDIIPYWAPFVDPTITNSDIDLYFLVITDLNGIVQAERQAWPNFIGEGGIIPQATGVHNFVANGQFLLHNAIGSLLPPTPSAPVGTISLPITIITPGGWTFERPADTLSVDNITFPPFGNYVDNPTASPRYACQVICSSPVGGDAKKDLSVKWFDVNKFSTPVSVGQTYTFSFTAQLNTGTTLPVSLVLIKNFGPAGDMPTEIPLHTFTVTNSFAIYNYTFSFGNNSGKTIDPAGGDYVQLALRFPNSSFNCSVTDVVLATGQVTITTFPETTDAEFNAPSLAGWVPPQKDNSTLGLPVIRTLNGFGFDSTIVGKIFPQVSATPGFGELATDGAAYNANAYSADGIPYNRIFNKLFDNTDLIPIFGTGANFATAILSSSNQQIILSQNSAGPNGIAIDGVAIPTGFAFNRINNTIGPLSVAGAPPTRLSTPITTFINNVPKDNLQIPTAGPGFTNIISVGRFSTAITPQVASVTFSMTPSAMAGLYFNLYVSIGFNSFWYSFNGSPSTPPVGTGSPVQINLSTLDTIYSVAQKTALAINGQASTSITPTAASSITPGAFFTLQTSQGLLVVWYMVGGMGSQPVSGGVFAKVTLSGTETASQVASATVRSINSLFFATPKLNGLFIRAYDSTSLIDTQAGLRISNPPVPGYGGSLVGTYEPDNFGYHNHLGSGNTALSTGSSALSGSGSSQAAISPYNGSTETVTKNITMNYVIKY